MKIKLRRATNNQLYFVIVARNGKVVAQSETYKTRQSVNKTVKLFGYPVTDESAKVKPAKKVKQMGLFGINGY